MSTPLHLRIDDGPRSAYSCELALPLIVGRQADGSEELYQQRQESGRARLVIARREEQTISRRHALLDPLPDGRVRVTNLSGNLSVRMLDGQELRPGMSCEVPPPLGLILGRKTIRVDVPDIASDVLQSLPGSTLPPGLTRGPASLSDLSATIAAAGQGDRKAILEWLEAVIDVFQCAAGAGDFFDKAAQAVVDMADLDSGHILLLQGSEWRTVADYTRPGLLHSEFYNAEEWRPSRTVLERVRRDRSPVYPSQMPPSALGASLHHVTSFVAAPILNAQGNVIGVLYGDGRRVGRAAGKPLTEVEARLVELLARGVAAGLARLEQERAILGERVRFEQFFSEELSRQLAAKPDMLDARDCKVTLLFSDVRRFAAISERLPTQKTVAWLSDVMTKLSKAVQDHGGVLVEYIGDELLAMWGAPEAQENQAVLACRAALDMLRAMPGLNARWQSELGEPTSLAIGINTGITCVGNTGTPYKFRYGPLGKTVNLASRVRGATKFLQCDLLITGGTAASLNKELPTRRLCNARVVHMEEPVELHEVVLPERADWPAQKSSYERALRAFEAGDFQGALQTLGVHLGAHAGDGPALVLLSRTIERLLDKSSAFDPVWDLPGK